MTPQSPDPVRDAELPAPLVSSDVDGRDHKTLPLPIEEVLVWGELGREPNARVYRAVIDLMAWAWRSRPAASVPNTPRLANVVYANPAWWRRHGPAVLKHFVLCSDNRYYHPGLAEILNKRAALKARDLGVSASEWLRLRRAVFERDAGVCQYCGTDEAPLDCDHVIPLSRGGKSTLSNLVASCFSCNRQKGNRTPEEWGASKLLEGAE